MVGTITSHGSADGWDSGEVCGWLGHDWGWGLESCGLGHLFRVCGRCALLDSDCDGGHGCGSAVAA